MEYVVKTDTMILIKRKVSELKTTKIYHDTFVDVFTNSGKSGAFLFSLIIAEFKRKYKGVDVKFDASTKTVRSGGWIQQECTPYVTLTFYDPKVFNKFKMVEGLLGKE
jgi:hypothetical protein